MSTCLVQRIYSLNTTLGKASRLFDLYLDMDSQAVADISPSAQNLIFLLCGTSAVIIQFACSLMICWM